MITVTKAAEGALRQEIEVRGHRFYADASTGAGGEGEAPDPHELLDAALGACTAITVTMVARRKQMPLEDVRVRITHEETRGAGGGSVYTLRRRIELVGPLSDEQRAYLLGIADKCPIHKALGGHFDVRTELA